MKKVALSKVAEIDRTVATDDECLTLPYVGLEHVEKERGRFVEDFVPTPLNMLATNFRFTPKHVLYGKLRPYLNKVVLPNFDGVCTTEILPILPNEEKLDRTFLWAILLSPTFVNWATSQISGANLPRLDPKLLAEYEIPLPPLDEQKRIASLLARADRLRQLRRHARRLADSLLQSLFVEMFGDPGINSNGWDIVDLQELSRLITDGTHVTPTYLQSGIPFISTVHVSEKGIDWDNAKYISLEEHRKLTKRCKPEVGDILYTKVGSVGLALPVPDEREFSIFVQLALIKIRKELCNLYYLVQYLNMPQVRNPILAKLTGATMKYIGVGDIGEIKVILPPLPLQEEFARAAARVESLRRRMSEGERQAEGLFQSLLAESFDGGRSPKGML